MLRAVPAVASCAGLLIATATADRWTTFAILFMAQVLAWAGVPAIGAAAMAAAGVLASQGQLHLWAVIVVATIGAEIGGLVGWQWGHRVARAGLDNEGGDEAGREGRLAARRTQALGAGERFEQRWGRLVVFFVPSWVSGALGMPFRQFSIWNVLAALAYALAAGLGAYGIGSAASGGSLASSLVPLIIAAAAFGAIVLAFVLWRRRHPDVGPSGT